MKTKPVFLYALALTLAAVLLPGCNATQTAGVATFNSGVKADLASPAGKKLIAETFASATSITVAALGEGTNIGADVAAADSLGGILEACSQLPTTTGQLKEMTATAASTSTAVSKATPQIVDLITQAQSKGLDPQTAIETVAKGVYAATGINPVSVARWSPPMVVAYINVWTRREHPEFLQSR